MNTALQILLILLLSQTCINGFLIEYTITNTILIIFLSTILMYGFCGITWMFVMCCIVAFLLKYEFILKSYKVTKKTLNNLIQLVELDNNTQSMSKITKDELTKLKSIKLKIIWFEELYKNFLTTYQSVKTITNNNLNNNCLKENVDIVMLFLNNLYLFVKSVCVEYFIILKDLPIFGLCISECDLYYQTSIKLYESNMSDDSNNLLEPVQDDMLQKLDEMNDFFNMMMPTLENQTDVKLNTPLNIPSDKELLNIFQTIGKMAQAESEQKIVLKKKKRKV